MIKYSGSNVITKLTTLIKTKFDSLATVARTGNYDDLLNKPEGSEVIRGTVTTSSANTSVVNIPFSIPNTDNLVVYQSGLLLTPTLHYTATTSAITLVGYTVEAGIIFTFISSTAQGAAVSLNATAAQVLFSDTTEDNCYDGCSNVQAALESAPDIFARADHTHQVSDIGLWDIATDLNAETSSGVVNCDSNTLNTPYKAGLTTYSSGTCNIISIGSAYITQRYTVSQDDRAFRRTYSSGSWSSWSNLQGTILSENADYAEVVRWSDSNTSSEDRTGYFVSLDATTPGNTIVKATSTSDVRGVTMATPGFSANATADKFDSSGNLLPAYSHVGFAGFIPVRIDSTITAANVRCMPNSIGIATLSSNNLGYQVIELIDSTHALILVEPSADMIKRIKDDINMKLSLSGGTMSGALVAHSNSDYTTKQVRNIFLSTSEPTSSDGENGDIWIVYEA